MSNKKWVISTIVAVVVIIFGIAGYQAYSGHKQVANAKEATTLAINKLNDEEYKNDTKQYLKPYSKNNVDVSVIPASDYSSSEPKFYVTVKYADVDWDKVKYNYKEVSYDVYNKQSEKDGETKSGGVHTLMKVVNGGAKFYVVNGVKKDTIKFKKNTKVYLVNSKTKHVSSSDHSTSGSPVYSSKFYKVEKN